MKKTTKKKRATSKKKVARATSRKVAKKKTARKKATSRRKTTSPATRKKVAKKKTSKKVVRKRRKAVKTGARAKAHAARAQARFFSDVNGLMDEIKAGFAGELIERALAEAAEELEPKMGRPRLTYDPELMIKLGVMGSSRYEIAMFLGWGKRTVDERFSKDETFGMLYDVGKAVRLTSIRTAQTRLAAEGNVAMLKHLGEHELGQVRKAVLEHRREDDRPRKKVLLPSALENEDDFVKVVKAVEAKGRLPGDSGSDDDIIDVQSHLVS